MFEKLKLLLEFIFGFELFQDNEILRTAGKFKFTGESVLNKLSTNFTNKNKRYYPFTNMVVHYLCINDVVINEKTKVLQLRWCLFFGWHSVNFWRQSGNRGRFSLLPGCTLFLGVYCTRARESMRLAMKGAPHCWILTIFSSGQPNTIDVKTFWDCALAGKVQLFSEGHKNLHNFLFDRNWLLTIYDFTIYIITKQVGRSCQIIQNWGKARYFIRS